MTPPTAPAAPPQAASALPLLPPPPPAPDWALFLDIDGTLIDHAPTPDAVQVPPTLPGHLVAATARLDGALALISGRSIAAIDALFDPLRLAAAGQHGSEWRPHPAGPVEPLARPLPDHLRRAAADLAAALPGVLVEQKSHALAVHFRLAPEHGDAVGAALADAVAAAGLIMLRGRFVWEIKDPALSKGTAVERFLAAPGFAGRRPVFIGDDTTDEDGFRAVEARGGLAFGVGPLAAARPGRPGFAGPDAVRAWLAAFAAGPAA